MDFLTPEDILRVQEQIKKDNMKKRRYIKNDGKIKINYLFYLIMIDIQIN